MRIIDLLNKIANGEEPPKKILFGDTVYEYFEDKRYKDYRYKDEKTGIYGYLSSYIEFNGFDVLNNEVEIIEEDKKIEKLNIELNSFDDNKVNCYRANNLECDLAFKINEVIDEVNKLKDDNK